MAPRRRRAKPSMKAVLRAHESGRRLKVPRDPPAVVDTPWNSMVLQSTGQGDTTVSGLNLVPLLTVQAGFTAIAGLGFDFRVQSVRVWSLVAGTPIRLSCYGFDNTNSKTGGALCVLDDWPGRLSFAGVGYEFPMSVQNIVYSEDSNLKICQIDVGASNDWLAYFNILWRGNKYKPFAETVRYQAATSQLRAEAPAFYPMDQQ